MTRDLLTLAAVGAFICLLLPLSEAALHAAAFITRKLTTPTDQETQP